MHKNCIRTVSTSGGSAESAHTILLSKNVRPLSHIAGVLALACALVIGGCNTDENVESEPPPVPPIGQSDMPVLPGQPAPPVDTPPDIIPLPPATIDAIFPPSESDIADADSVYQSQGYGQTNVIRVDVRTVTEPGTCEKGDYSGCTLEDVQGDVDRDDDFKPRIEVHFSSDDFADDGTVNNAEFRQRGGSTRQAPQKSFRVRIDDKENLWRGERSLFLNKHPFESTRIRNKVAFDLMSAVPHLFSMRTQFTNLWIDDGLGPVDFGLFTHVESPGGNYLEKRGLNRDDRLYKVNLFNFSSYDLSNVQVDAAGEPLDEDIFERSMDIESGDDHSALVKMLTDFHDPSRSFDSILDQYFNRNNVLSWMAVNFLLNQSDAISQNFLLYNPVDTERFYFLPWDYDGALTVETEPSPQSASNKELQSRLFAGYARGSKSDFYSRYYREPGMHERMLEAATFIRQNYLTDERIDELASVATQAVKPFMSRSPDIDINGEYNEFTSVEFSTHVADNLDALATRFSFPMPPKLLVPELEQGEWVFKWRTAYDPTGHALIYELQISTALTFNPDDIVLQIENIDESAVQRVPDDQIEDITDIFGIIEQRIDATALLSGEYFARVIVRSSRDPLRFWQISENILLRDDVNWQGPLAFINP